jgi:plastocyanin
MDLRKGANESHRKRAPLVPLLIAEALQTPKVIMGVSGSFFNPAVLSAELGDTVTFVFGSGMHGVAESSFENPCFPLPGGFNSGLVSALNVSQPIESWDLIITNTSARAYPLNMSHID